MIEMEPLTGPVSGGLPGAPMEAIRTEYQRDYERATKAVQKAIDSGLIRLGVADDPEDDGLGHDKAVLKVAEYFMNALGVTPQ